MQDSNTESICSSLCGLLSYYTSILGHIEGLALNTESEYLARQRRCGLVRMLQVILAMLGHRECRPALPWTPSDVLNDTMV